MKFFSVLLISVACLLSCCDCLYRYSRERQLLDIMIPRILLQEFDYVPTKEGYRYSYQLADGTRREEVGFITNPAANNQGLASNDRDRDAKSRPRFGVKSRKLSPKTLQSLAG